MDHCPRGHLTIWPAACPTCKAGKTPFQGRQEDRAARLSQTRKDVWARRRAQALRAKLDRKGLR